MVDAVEGDVVPSNGKEEDIGESRMGVRSASYLQEGSEAVEQGDAGHHAATFESVVDGNSREGNHSLRQQDREHAFLKDLVRREVGHAFAAGRFVVLMRGEEIVFGEEEREKDGAEEEESSVAENPHDFRATIRNCAPKKRQIMGKRRYSLRRIRGCLRIRTML